jgi:excisionase family DNA binding protein
MENGGLESEIVALIERVAARVFDEKMREWEAARAQGGDGWLTVARIMAETGYSKGTIYEAIRRKQLEACRPTTRTIRVRRSALDKWLAA